jgi:hypothetical protein
VAFFLDFPGDIADQARDGSEEKFTFVHCELARLQNFSDVFISGFTCTNPETMVRRNQQDRVTKCSIQVIFCDKHQTRRYGRATLIQSAVQFE